MRIQIGTQVYEQQFGIRMVRILEQPDEPGTTNYNLCLALRDTASGKEYDFNEHFSSFVLVVNHRRILCKGANWAPCEPFVSEVTNEKQTRILELVAAAGINMIRIWGGGMFEGEEMWRYHTQSNPELLKELFDYQLLFAKGLLGDFNDGADRLFKLQYLQYEWIRTSFEMMRRNMWFSSGILYWMLADCWPAASGWALIDYYCMPKAAYYSFKRCAKDLVASITKVAEECILHLCNNTRDDYLGQLSIRVFDYGMQGNNFEAAYEQVLENVHIKGECVTSLSLPFVPDKQQILICDMVADNHKDRAFYKNGNLELMACNDVKIVNRTEDSITLKSDCYVHAVGLEGNYIFEDNYFSLLPGEERTVSLSLMSELENSDILIKAYSLV